jgi:hypothetical protein
VGRDPADVAAAKGDWGWAYHGFHGKGQRSHSRFVQESTVRLLMHLDTSSSISHPDSASSTRSETGSTTKGTTVSSPTSPARDEVKLPFSIAQVTSHSNLADFRSSLRTFQPASGRLNRGKA